MEKRVVLVTGSEGKVGSLLCPELELQFAVRRGVREGSCGGTPCDIRDIDAVYSAMEGVDSVVHLAGHPWEREIYSQMVPDNIIGTWNVFEAARRRKLRRVVFASTNHVVGGWLAENRCVDESVTIRPDSFYAVTKVFGEALGRMMAEKYGLSVICVRIGWVVPVDPTNPDERSRRLLASVRNRSLWVSPRDFSQFVKLAILAEDITFEILNCASANTGGLFDISRACSVLGYAPQDDVAKLSDLIVGAEPRQLAL